MLALVLSVLVADLPVVGPVPAALRTAWELSPAHRKHVGTAGLPILGSDRVTDEALVEAARVVRGLLACRPEVGPALVRNRVRLVVMARTEQTTDVPEHSDLRPAAFWNARARGLGATRERPAVSCGEENLLRLAGDRYPGECILVHEFAHAVHQLALADLDPGFDARLRACYDRATAAGRWAGTYARENADEYWAEAVQSYFDANDPTDRVQHNGVWSRERLADHDPEVYELVADAFRRPTWRYVSPRATIPPAPSP